MHMRNVWKQYHNGETSLVVAWRLTDDANNMIFHIDYDLWESYPDYERYFDCFESVEELLGIEMSVGYDEVCVETLAVHVCRSLPK